MNTMLITSKTYYRDGNKIRTKTSGGKFYVQKLIGGAWTTVFTSGEQGNSNNNFRLIVESGELKLQQLITTWTGTEGTDFTKVASWLKS